MMSHLIQRKENLEKILCDCDSLRLEVDRQLLSTTFPADRLKLQMEVDRLQAMATQLEGEYEDIRRKIAEEEKKVKEKQEALVAADADLVPIVAGNATNYIPKAPWDRLLPEVKADRHTILEALDVLIVEVTRFLEELEKNRQKPNSIPNKYERGAGYAYRLGKTQEALSLFDAEVESALSETKELLDKIKNLRERLSNKLGQQLNGIGQTTPNPGSSTPITVNLNLNMGCNDQNKSDGGHTINKQGGLHI